MKRLVICLFACVLVVSITAGCGSTNETLRGMVSAQEMIQDIALGNLDDAWNPVYAPMADENLKDNMEKYAELFDGREVKRCDCVDYEVVEHSGKRGGNYTETTYYNIYLTEDYLGEPDLYAKAVCIRDDNGEGIISLEISTEFLK